VISFFCELGIQSPHESSSSIPLNFFVSVLMVWILLCGFVGFAKSELIFFMCS
jgi:hypothetical protein